MIWDYIVIGAGSAGCALTHELARSGARVLVLEAGASDRSPYIKFPAGVLQACAKYDWGYRAEPDPSRKGAVEPWLRGKVLGGCSSINGTIFVRGAAVDFDRWAGLCSNRGNWSAQDVMPIFRELETSDQPGSSRGHAGPLHVRTIQRPHAITQAFLEAVRVTGFRGNEDYNGPSQEGVGYTQLTQRRGLRCSAADAFLKPLLRAGRNVTLIVEACVENIEVANGRASAVTFSRAGTSCRETARDVILCAGAINSPKLLMLSGIGDARELMRHNIDVVLDLPAVGCNLKDHPLLRLSYRTRIPTNNPTQGWLQKLGIAAEFVFHGEGPISNLFEGMGFLRSSDSQPLPDLQLFFLTTGYSKTTDGWKLPPYPAVMLYLAHSYPASTGYVRLGGNRPEDPPRIEYSLFENPSDVEVLARGVRIIRKIMGTEPMASLVAEEITPGSAVEDHLALESFIRGNSSICYHSIGTCRMGADSAAVVDPELRVRGTENLWIADASIMPAAISANTNAACMMIGAKLGKQLIARR
jgi:choline dehydrogenase